MRYLIAPTVKKTAVDKDRHVWTWDGEALDLVAEAQEPWMAERWKRRREAAELEALRAEVEATGAYFPKEGDAVRWIGQRDRIAGK